MCESNHTSPESIVSEDQFYKWEDYGRSSKYPKDILVRMKNGDICLYVFAMEMKGTENNEQQSD